MSLNKTNWKNRITILGVIITIATTAWTQQIKWSEKYEMSSIFNENEIIQASTKGFYVLQNYKDANYYYQKKIGFYDLNFKKQEGAKSIDFLYENVKGRYQGAIATKTRPYLFYAVDLVEQQKETLLVSSLESSSLDLSKESKKIGEVDYANRINSKDNYRYCTSPDGSKFLFYGKLPHNKKGNGFIGTLLVNADFEELGAKNIQLKQEGEILTTSDVVDAVVDNNGRAYLLCKIYKAKSKKEERKLGTRYIYSLIQMDENSEVQVLDTLKVLSKQDSAILVSARLSVNSTSGAITCLGTYKTRKKAGLFSLDLSQNFLGTAMVMDYPEEVIALEAKMPRKVKKKKHLSLKNYKVKSIFEQEDGVQIIIAEQHYINAYWDKSEGRQEIHQLNNILLLKLVDQKITWAKVLPKRQKGGGEGYTDVPEKLYSFYAFQAQETMHVLYNEMKENLKITNEFQLEKGYYNKPKDCYLVHCKIDLSSGALISKESVLGLKKDGVAVYPKESKLLEDGSLLLLGVKPEYSLKEPSYIRFGHWILSE